MVASKFTIISYFKLDYLSWFELEKLYYYILQLKSIRNTQNVRNNICQYVYIPDDVTEINDGFIKYFPQNIRL